jgi:MFS family permease
VSRVWASSKAIWEVWGGTFAFLVIAVAAAAYTRTSLAPVQEAMRGALHLTDRQMALLQGPALGMPLIIGAIPLGIAIDRLPRNRLLLAFCLCNLVGTVGSALSSNFYVLLCLRALVGFSSFATNPTALSIIADLYGPDLRGRATMITTLGQIVGMSSAFLLGGQVLSHTNNHTSWGAALFWMAVPIALAALFLFGMAKPKKRKGLLESPMRGAYREHAGAIGATIAGVAMAEIAFGAILVWGQPTLLRTYSIGVGAASGVMALALFISGTVGPIIGGLLADKSQIKGGPGQTAACLAILATISVPFALFPFSPGFYAAAIGLIVFITIASGICVMGTALFTIVVPEGVRGMWMAIFSALSVLFATGLAPLAVAWVSDSQSGVMTIGVAIAITCGAAMAIGAAIFGVSRVLLFKDIPPVRPCQGNC